MLSDYHPRTHNIAKSFWNARIRHASAEEVVGTGHDAATSRQARIVFERSFSATCDAAETADMNSAPNSHRFGRNNVDEIIYLATVSKKYVLAVDEGRLLEDFHVSANRTKPHLGQFFTCEHVWAPKYAR
jgi:hypothetical protein